MFNASVEKLRKLKEELASMFIVVLGVAMGGSVFFFLYSILCLPQWTFITLVTRGRAYKDSVCKILLRRLVSPERCRASCQEAVPIVPLRKKAAQILLQLFINLSEKWGPEQTATLKPGASSWIRHGASGFAYLGQWPPGAIWTDKDITFLEGARGPESAKLLGSRSQQCS